MGEAAGSSKSTFARSAQASSSDVAETLSTPPVAHAALLLVGLGYTPVRAVVLALLVGELWRYVSRTTDPIEVEGDAAPVEVRVSQIERALSNLIANAIAWNEPGLMVALSVCNNSKPR